MIQRLLLLSLLAAASCFPAAAQDRTVNVSNWADYIDPDVLEEFTRQTGIKVVYDVYDKNETLEARLRAGQSGYDVVVVSGPVLQRSVEARRLLPLDAAQLPNITHMWGDIQQKLAAYDPGNKFAVNYMWGTVGIGVNVRKVRDVLGDIPLQTWDTVLDIRKIEKLKNCGVMMLDAPDDIFPGILRALKINPNTRIADDYRRASAALVRIRNAVAKFHSHDYVAALANGDICLAVGYSGDLLQARKQAIEAQNDVEIAYIIPREGAQMSVDSFAIPADATNVKEAHAFIDFMMRPEMAARNVNAVAFASGNRSAREKSGRKSMATRAFIRMMKFSYGCLPHRCPMTICGRSSHVNGSA